MNRSIPALMGVLALTATVGLPAADAAEHRAARQRFIIHQTSPEDAPLAAFGAIHAKGTDVIVNNRRDRFEFPDGTLVIKHKATKGAGFDRFDEVTCLFRFLERGTWQVVDGTGAYAGAEGQGRYRAAGGGFQCEGDEEPEGFFAKVVARGSLSF